MRYLSLILRSTILTLPSLASIASTDTYGPKHATKANAPLSQKVVQRQMDGLETITSALESAYMNNTELAAAVSKLTQTDETVVQAKAGFRPKVDGTLGVNFNYTKNSGDSVRLNQSLVRSKTTPNTSAGVRVTQNIYSGGSTVAEVKGAENSVLSSRAQLLSAEQAVFFAVTESFLGILTTQAEIEQYEGNVKALQNTLDATNDRFKVGEETRTSIAQSHAQLQEGKAQLEEARARLEAQHATFQKITGRRARALSKPILSKELPQTLEQAIQISMENNPSIIKAKFDQAAAKYNIDRIGGGLLPRIDLQGSRNYTHANNISDRGFSQNRTKNQTDTWDAAVTMTVPIYEQGQVRSQKRQAHEISAEKRIDIETARRRVTEELIAAWQSYAAAKGNIELFKAQVKDREISLEGTIQEKNVGTKILLDELNAQRDLLSAKLNLIRAERTFYQQYFRILLSMGALTSKQMLLKVQHYDPRVHYNETKSKV